MKKANFAKNVISPMEHSYRFFICVTSQAYSEKGISKSKRKAVCSLLPICALQESLEDQQERMQEGTRQLFQYYVQQQKQQEEAVLILQEQKCDSSGVAWLKKGGNTVGDARGKAEVLNSQFSSVTDLTIMDFAKAQDKVPHRRLLHKLDYYGIRGSTHKWISSWLSGRSQQVVLGGQASDPVPVLSGVPQGSVLGPILFLIFINDLRDNLKSSVRLFADDCVLYRNIHSLQDCLILQKDLDSLGIWEADWQMKFNVAKCHSMRVTRHYSHKQIIHDYTLHQQTLENVQSAKYLGITITENMDWGQHISDISSKATKTLGFLRRNLAFAPRSTKEVAYKTLVRPKLEYAAPIWSPYCKTQIQQVEKVQRTAARWTCRRWRNTSSVGEMLDELQWPTLEAQRDQSSLLFFHKIHCGTMSIDKDKYLTPSKSTRSTRSSHNSQYCRPQTYSDALKYSFFPRTIPHWNSLAPSVIAAETTEEFRALIYMTQPEDFFFFSLKISKKHSPQKMIIYDCLSIRR